MKNKSRVLYNVVICVLIIACISFFLYDVLCNKVPFEKRAFGFLAVVCILISTLIKINGGVKKRSLDFYEDQYKKELGDAFKGTPSREKLLCALRLYNENKNEKAIRYICQLQNENNTQQEAQTLLLFKALIYTDMGMNDAALQNYQKIVENYEASSTVYSNMGLIYKSQGDIEAALRCYSQACRLNPENPYAYNNIASAYFESGDYENAKTNSEKALEIKPIYQAASLLSIIYYLEKDEANGKKYFQMAVARGQDSESLKKAILQYSCDDLESCLDPLNRES